MDKTWNFCSLAEKMKKKTSVFYFFVLSFLTLDYCIVFVFDVLISGAILFLPLIILDENNFMYQLLSNKIY